eukprot:scaffold204384_cov23-Tisochrysis_lutea.AAC.1
MRAELPVEFAEAGPAGAASSGTAPGARDLERDKEERGQRRAKKQSMRAWNPFRCGTLSFEARIKRQWKWKLTYKAGTHHKNPSFSIPPMCTTQHLHARLYRSCWAAGHANVGGQGSIS